MGSGGRTRHHMPMDFILGYQLLISRGVGHHFHFLGGPRVVVVKTRFSYLLRVGPGVAIGFLLLGFSVVHGYLYGRGSGPFTGFAREAMFTSFAGALFGRSVGAYFLFGFASYYLVFIFAIFGVSLQGTPVSTITILCGRGFHILSTFMRSGHATQLFMGTRGTFRLGVFRL